MWGERGRKGRGIAGTRELELTDRLVPKLPGDGRRGRGGKARREAVTSLGPRPTRGGLK